MAKSDQEFRDFSASQNLGYLICFFLVFVVSVATMEWVFSALGVFFGKLLNIVGYAIASFVTALVLARNFKRPIGVNEFSSFAFSAMSFYALLSTVAIYVFGPLRYPGSPGVCGCGIVLDILAIAIQLGLIYLCLRFVLKPLQLRAARRFE